MKKLCVLFTSILALSPAWADVNLEPLLNKVTVQLKAEQWVTSKTALVNVAINASVSNQGIESIQNAVMQKLAQLSNKSEWHIVSFDRQLDKSGLENMQMIAQARLPQTELANLRDKAKSISKPGETFTIDSVLFTPSDAELKQANMDLRNNLYQQVKTEIESLNKQYPDQKYYLHQLDFQSLMPTPIFAQMNTMVAMKASVASTSSSSLAVGNKQELLATAVLAAMPDIMQQKLTHN
jgi:hypothetical protein